MRMRGAAVAACLMALWASVSGHRYREDDAGRGLWPRQASPPELRVVDARRDVVSAELDRAGLHPGLNLGVGIENVVGSTAPASPVICTQRDGTTF